MSIEAEHEEVFSFIENNRLMGKGIGYVDAQLVASAVLTGVPIWTLDKKLSQVADGLHIKHRFSRDGIDLRFQATIEK